LRDLLNFLKSSGNPDAQKIIAALIRMANWPIAPERRMYRLGRVRPSCLYEWIGNEMRGEEG